MAQNIRPPLVQQVAAPQHYAPPTPREMRAQAVHRLQIGILGLAAMLLLVGLANIIMNRVRLSDAVTGASGSAAMEKGSGESDPLADIGVAPSTGPSETAVSATKKR
jgi:hypothetical protein